MMSNNQTNRLYHGSSNNNDDNSIAWDGTANSTTGTNHNNYNSSINSIRRNDRMIDDLFTNPSVLNSLPSFSKPPAEFICPLETGQRTMKDPVQSLSTGIVFERANIASWAAEHGDMCPVTGRNLGFLVSHKHLKDRIQNWRQQVKGLRRIRRKSPTTFCLVDNSSPSASPLSMPPDEYQQHYQQQQDEEESQKRPAQRQTSSGDQSDIASSPETTTDIVSTGNPTAEMTLDTPPPPTRPLNEKFAQIDTLLPSFVEAGISDYRHRIKTRENQRKLKTDTFVSRSSSSLDNNDTIHSDTDVNDSDEIISQNMRNGSEGNNGDVDSQPGETRYRYNTDFYPSIFNRGPKFAQSRSI